MKLRRYLVALTFGFCAVTPTAMAQTDATAPAGITIKRGWTHVLSVTGGTIPAYFTVHNAGTAPDTLVSATCPIAHHTLLIDGGGKALGDIVIGAGQTLVLAPKATHLALQDNRFRLYPHAMIPCSVDFLNAGKLILYLHVEPHDASGYQQVRRPVVKN